MKLRHNNRFFASTDDVLSTGSTQKRCLQMGHACDVVEIPQSRMATATSRLPVRDIRDTVNPLRGFDQSAMLTSYRVWDNKINYLELSFCRILKQPLSRLHQPGGISKTCMSS